MSSTCVEVQRLWALVLVTGMQFAQICSRRPCSSVMAFVLLNSPRLLRFIVRFAKAVLSFSAPVL